MKNLIFLLVFFCFINNCFSQDDNTSEDILINGLSISSRRSLLMEHSITDYLNNWVYICENDNAIYLFKEVKPYNSYEDYLQVWVKTIPKNEKLSLFRKDVASGYNSTTLKQKILLGLSNKMMLYVIDCKESKMNVKSVYLYNKEGNVINSATDSYFSTYSLDEVIPETIGESILNTICDFYAKY